MMDMHFCSLNSGSNGNCYYVGNHTDAVLVDAGLSCRETEKRMTRLGLDMNRVRAIFISHEHGDHIRGLERLACKYQLPVYITDNTLRHSRLDLQKCTVRSFHAKAEVQTGSLSITAFPKFHDASEPHSFVISGNGIHIGVFTDIGQPCSRVAEHFSRCHAVFLEANYDETMLENGRYPYHLKTRIRGGNGHLSNRQALEIFLNHKSKHLSHLLLAHLSADNNCPELVGNLFKPYAGTTKIIVTSRQSETPVFSIRGTLPAPAQLSMF